LNYAPARRGEETFLGHPRGLFLLFIVEMWERFSYYGMRALLVLYLVEQAAGANPGRGWSKEAAAKLYGTYTGMAYLLPIFGGLIADKLIGAHRSMLIGGLIISLGHIALAISGLGGLAHNALGISIFVAGLVLIVIGTGHFKPNVSVMVGALYPPDDPRRDGAFTIFYMGINLGAFICAFVCGTLGEKVGWHWGFGSAAVGMIIGLIVHIAARPRLLGHIGDAPPGKPNYAPLFVIAALLLSAAVGALFHFNTFSRAGESINILTADGAGRAIAIALRWLLIIALIAWPIWFVSKQERSDRGPTAAILIFIVFNAIFWLAFEQAGSSLNLFAAEMTDRYIGSWEMPATWFQSVGPLQIILLAPLFAALWSALARRNLNPSMPMKIAMALLLLGGGFVFMVVGSLGTSPTNPASMFWLIATYTMLTLGELCISPTGLSFVTRAAPVRYVSFLMGIWFLSNALANYLGGQIAGKIEKIESGQIQLFWYRWFKLEGQADFFLLFVISSVGAGLLVLLLTPWLKRLIAGRE
jgi:POT family proton-dependent oligopeptide transporter